MANMATMPFSSSTERNTQSVEYMEAWSQLNESIGSLLDKIDRLVQLDTDTDTDAIAALIQDVDEKVCLNNSYCFSEK